MRRIIACALVALTACKGGSAPRADAAPAAAAPLQNDTEKTLYALGLIMGQRMRPFSLTAPELAIVQRGIADSVTGRPPAVEIDTWGPRVNEMARARMGAGGGPGAPPPPNPGATAAERERGRAFADRAAGVFPGAAPL
jgi:FKBP-type peptidyl-prolyl cis-trans isomerase FkpA